MRQVVPYVICQKKRYLLLDHQVLYCTSMFGVDYSKQVEHYEQIMWILNIVMYVSDKFELKYFFFYEITNLIFIHALHLEYFHLYFPVINVNS